MAVNWLTNQEKWVIGVVLGLLLTGWVTKSYRAAHPSNPEAKPTLVLIQASP